MQENLTRQLHGTQTLTAPHIKVHIERHAWNKMYGWCKAARSEVSGMGLVSIIDDTFVVTDVFLPKQYCSSGYTELDDVANSKLQERLIRRGTDMKQYRFWWHTHYNFNVFWSGTDDDNAKEQMKCNGEWELSVVINQKGEYRARADFMTLVHPLLNFPQHYLVDELPVFLIPDSKYHRRKRNFRSDIRRWVKPMSELPESQKPKITVHTPPVYQGQGSLHDEYGEFHFPGFGPSKDEDWSEKWRKERQEREGRDVGFHYTESRRDTKYDKKDDTPAGKKYVNLKNGDKFGPYIYYEGILISPPAWENIRKGMKLGTGSEDTSKKAWEGNAEDWHRYSQGEDGSDTPKAGECACGSSDCWEGSKCIPCTLCGGRFNVSSGQCPGCVKVQKQNVKGKCLCPHSGNWEDCCCNQECNKCLDSEYAMYGGSH